MAVERSNPAAGPHPVPLYLCGVLSGVGIGLFLGRPGPLTASVATVGLATVSLAIWLLRDSFKQLSKERLTHLRGAQAEALVAWLLLRLPAGWHVFNSVQVEPEWDIDHVLVGPAGIFCVSTKSVRGLFTEVDGKLCHNNEPTDFHHQAIRQAMTLRDWLGGRLGGPVPYVHAVLAVPFAYVGCRSPYRNNVHLLHMENLYETLEDMRGSLDGGQVARYARELQHLQQSPPAAKAASTEPGAVAKAA